MDNWEKSPYLVVGGFCNKNPKHEGSTLGPGSEHRLGGKETAIGDGEVCNWRLIVVRQFAKLSPVVACETENVPDLKDLAKEISK